MSKVYRYLIPTIKEPKYDSWSLWLLDEDSQSLCILGDYGEWTYMWGFAKNKCFRSAILSFNKEYIGGKLAQGKPRELDHEGTKEAIKTSLLDGLPDPGMLSDEDEAHYKAVDDIYDEYTFYEHLREYPDDSYHGCETLKEQYWLSHLMEVTLPRVKAEMHNQLFREAALGWYK